MYYDFYTFRELLHRDLSAQPPTPSVLTAQIDFLVFSRRNIVEVGTWRLSFLLGLCAIVIYFMSRLKDLYLPARILWGYAICYSLLTLEFPGAHFGPNHAAFQAWAGMNAVEVILIPLFALTISERGLARVFYALRWVMLAEILCAVTGTRGLLLAPSFNLAFVALYLPFAPVWLWMVGVAAICTHHAGAAQAMLGTYAILWCWRNLRRRYFALALAAIVPSVLAVAYYHSHAPLLDGAERLDRWFGRFLTFWLHGTVPGQKPTQIVWQFVLFGVGPATFMWSSMMIDKFRAPVVLFMHNDFLQIPWELGLAGLGLALIVYAAAVKRSWADFRLRMAFAALVPLGLLWHPLRFFPSAFLVALLFRLGLNGKGLSFSGKPLLDHRSESGGQ